ncbi:MAG: LacI family transcriptional regulator [Treponema sp.]|jgi:LacI family transcriptional regulator|nr:LacI family transcriptional regulator [Treponema sp.]
MVSIKDIAKRAGMSPSTVSRVVTGKNNVNPKKRELILKLIEETGYVPNKAAREMVMRRSFAVAIVIPDMFNIFQRQLFSIIERYLISFGYHTLFFFVKPDASSEKDCITRLKEERLDGIIMLHEIKDREFYQYLSASKIHAVSTILNTAGIPAITIDDRQAAIDAMNHLINLGHKNIDMIGGASFFSFGVKRIEGYKEALEAGGLGFDEMRLVNAPLYNMESGMYGMRELMLRSRDFTAVFAGTDELALGAIRTLEDHRIRVPDDVSVIGIDDIDIAGYFCPRLTTIRQPLIEIGEQSALLLHRLISGQGVQSAGAVLPHSLIIRESTSLTRRGQP